MIDVLEHRGARPILMREDICRRVALGGWTAASLHFAMKSLVSSAYCIESIREALDGTGRLTDEARRNILSAVSLVIS